MKVLFVMPDLSDPAAKGYQVRALALANGLRSAHETKLVSAAGSTAGSCRAQERPLIRMFQILESFFRGWPLQSALFDGRDTARCVSKKAREWGADVIVVVTERLPWTATELAAELPVVVDVVDDMRVHMVRRADSATGPMWRLKRLFWLREAAGFTKTGSRLYSCSRAMVAASPNGLDRYPKGYVIANAAASPSHPRPETRFDIAFTGNLQYEPNVRAVFEVCNRIIPAVREHFPQLRAVVAGRDPVKAVVETCLKAAVPLLANVPDMAEILGSTRLALAPVSWTPAANLKVIEALAVGTPVLAYPQAAAQLPTPLSGLRVCADAAEMALDAVRFLRGELKLAPVTDGLATWRVQAQALEVVLRTATSYRETKD